MSLNCVVLLCIFEDVSKFVYHYTVHKQHNTTHISPEKVFFREKRAASGEICTHDALLSRQSALPTELHTCILLHVEAGWDESRQGMAKYLNLISGEVYMYM